MVIKEFGQDPSIYLAKDILKQQLQGDQNVVGVGIGSGPSLQVRVKQASTSIPASVDSFEVNVVVVGDIKAMGLTSYNDKGELIVK